MDLLEPLKSKALQEGASGANKRQEAITAILVIFLYPNQDHMENHLKGLTGNTDNKPILEISTTNGWVESISNLGLKSFVPKKRQFHFTVSQIQC